MEDRGCRFLILECLIVNERELKERAKRFRLRVNIVTVADTRRTSMERFASTSRGRPVR